MSPLRRLAVAIALAMGAGGLAAFGGVMMSLQGGKAAAVLAFAAAIVVMLVATGEDDPEGLPQ